jgi:hypothetical protein
MTQNPYFPESKLEIFFGDESVFFVNNFGGDFSIGRCVGNALTEKKVPTIPQV